MSKKSEQTAKAQGANGSTSKLRELLKAAIAAEDERIRAEKELIYIVGLIKEMRQNKK